MEGNGFLRFLLSGSSVFSVVKSLFRGRGA